MGLHALLYLYGRRVRAYPVQELLAGLGIAIGVALAFAVMVSTGSIVASASEVMRGVTGSADLQLTARDRRGFDARLLRDVRRMPGVAHAAPLIEQRAVLIGPDGREVPVTIASIDPTLAALSGTLTRSFAPGGFKLGRGVMIPSATAEALGLPSATAEIGAQPLPQIQAHVRGRAVDLTVAAVLGRDTVGPLTDAQLAVAPLAHLRRVTGMQGQVTRILVDAAAGQEEVVRRNLVRLAPSHLTVTAADSDIRLLEQATGPTNQVTGFFATISALLGLLLAFNAMLLTAPERRRLVSALRVQGFTPRQVVLLVLFQASVLGVVASSIGVIAGSFLAGWMFSESPEYLASGFTLGARTIVGNAPVIVSLVGGILASCLAAAPALLDLRRARAVDAVFHERGAPGNAVSAQTRQRMLFGSVAAFVAATAMLVWLPQAALAASGLLAIATLLAIPTTFALVLRLVEGIVERVPRLATLTVAVLAMRATTLRSLALAATGAVAVFGSVAIGGARDDLLRGLGDYAEEYVATADIWVVNPADNQATNDLRSHGLVERIRSVPAVDDVRRYHGGFIDIKGRRVWVIARSVRDEAMLPATQMVDGDLATATKRLRRGGWVAVSERIAEDHGVGPGDRLTVPGASGSIELRVAATTTNLGWAPGAIILSSTDYRRVWSSPAPTALEIDVADGASLETTVNEVERAMGTGSGLRAQAAGDHAKQMKASAQQGLERLSQISQLLLIAAVLAMAAAMGAAIWQRRAGLAALRLQSFRPRQLWLLLLLEAAAILGAGGVTGAITGMYGQLGADRYLADVTGFPVTSVPAGWQTVLTFCLVVPTALLIVAVPGWVASRVPPQLGLGNE
ncbi:MAG: FtsX-like permease family protein [Thermoleophilaceae bacterium]